MVEHKINPRLFRLGAGTAVQFRRFMQISGARNTLCEGVHDPNECYLVLHVTCQAFHYTSDSCKIVKFPLGHDWAKKIMHSISHMKFRSICQSPRYTS